MAQRPRLALPIDEHLPRIVAGLAHTPNAILRAPTGSGKTTRLPPALVDSPWCAGRAVCVLEPRRLAARAAARRIAFERGVELGNEVGYRVRFDARASDATRIEIVTEGLFLRMLQDDPALERFGAIVFDEFHERNLASDLALALVRRVQCELRDDLRIVVTSATLDAERLVEFLEPAAVFETEGRLYPVEIRYAPPRGAPTRGAAGQIAATVADAVRTALDTVEGDVLAFLPGVGEIRSTRRELEKLRGVALVELYGDLAPEAQDAALSRGRERRVVLATNVAESSVTVAGIAAVVDSGVARELRYDANLGLDRLELVRISRASADQRTGRAGREGPGLCLRLWDARDERSLADFAEPEVRRVDLAGAFLELVVWGERDPATFPWFEAPTSAALERARELLTLLGALAVGIRLTERGRQMTRLPVHPRLAALLLEGARSGCTEQAALAAALCSERDVFPREAPAPGEVWRAARHVSDSDVLDRVQALLTWERHGKPRGVQGLRVQTAHFVLRARDQLLALASRKAGRRPRRDAAPGAAGATGATGATETDGALLRALLAAYPDRVVRRRGGGQEVRGVLVGGRGVKLAAESAVRDAELFIAVVLDAGRRGERAEALVRQASLVERDWLAEELVSEDIELEFDARRKVVVAKRRTRYVDLILDEVEQPAPRSAETAALLARAAGERLSTALALDDEGLVRLLARTRSLAAWRPELELPTFDEDELRALLPELCHGATSFAELRKTSLAAHVRARLGSKLALLDREAPERLEVPSGNRITLTYEPGRPPVLAVRIQELFGWRETPRVAGGRVAVLLHLLAPNMRPSQVTDDLESFWNNTYAQVRRELRRRYPKHSWPEDPWTARAERRPGKSRRREP